MRQITISGNVGKDAILANTQSGQQVANFSVAVKRNRPDNNGQYGSDWFRCSVWGKKAAVIQRFYHKGSHVTVSGDLELSEYNGQTQLNVAVVSFDLPDNNGGQNNKPHGNNQRNNTQNSGQGQGDRFANNGGQIDISSDDLPF